MPASRRQVGSGPAGDMRSVAEGPKGRATGAFPRVTESARPDMREGSVATVVHIEKIQPRWAKKRRTVLSETPIHPNGHSPSSAAMRCYTARHSSLSLSPPLLVKASLIRGGMSSKNSSEYSPRRVASLLFQYLYLRFSRSWYLSANSCFLLLSL